MDQVQFINLYGYVKYLIHFVFLITDSIIPKESLPQLSTLILLDSVIAKVQIALIDEEVRESSKSAGNRNSPTSTELVQDIMPHVIQLAKAVHNCIR